MLYLATKGGWVALAVIVLMAVIIIVITIQVIIIVITIQVIINLNIGTITSFK